MQANISSPELKPHKQPVRVQFLAEMDSFGFTSIKVYKAKASCAVDGERISSQWGGFFAQALTPAVHRGPASLHGLQADQDAGVCASRMSICR